MTGRSRCPLVPDIPGVDLDFRPSSYHADRNPLAAVLQNVKGSRRREMIADFLRGDAPPALGGLAPHLLADTVDDAKRVSLGRINPRFMGGEYLPDYRCGDLEIARIVLDSSTQDVYSLRARRSRPDGPWRYSMVDEYEAAFQLTELPLPGATLARIVGGSADDADADC